MKTVPFYPNPYTTDTLGEWSDELKGKHYSIFAALAPKDYGGILNDGSYKGKIKGMKVDGVIEQSISNENRNKLLKREITGILCKQNRFILDSNHTITTKDIYKLWTYHFDKRISVMLKDNLLDTFPYGYLNMPIGVNTDEVNFTLLDAETNKNIKDDHIFYTSTN